MELKTFPDRIYHINYCGYLTVMVKLDRDKINHCVAQENENPYTEIGMLCPYSDEPWQLKDYESNIEHALNGETRVCYSCLSLEGINKHLEGKGEHQCSDIWTLNLDDAIKVSKERYAIHHPHGKAYDVVSYWDDCDRKVLNSEPLLYSEAQELLKICNIKKRYGSLYYYGVEVHVHKEK